MQGPEPAVPAPPTPPPPRRWSGWMALRQRWSGWMVAPLGRSGWMALPRRWSGWLAPSRGSSTRQAALVAALVLALAWLGGELRLRTGWDDTYYLLQVSSLVEDGDLDLRNDALYSTLAPRELQAFLTATLPSGSLKNTFSIGPSVMWLPAYVAGRPWDAGAGPAGGRRWSRAQMVALHLLSLAFLAAVTWFLCRLIEDAGRVRERPQWESQGLALLAASTLLIGTPLAVYGPAVYTMAHLPSAVATCLFMASVLWLERDRRLLPAFLAGVALGLVFLVRWQDAVFALLLWVPLAPLLGRRRDLPRLALVVAAIAAGAVAVASLQPHVWHLEQGSWLTVPQGDQYMLWSRPHLRELLFSGYSGLLAWSPVFGLAAAGLLLPWRCRLSPRWRLAALAVLAIEVYVNAAVRDWWGGFSFGARRMSSCVPLLALGLANLAAFAAAASRGGGRRPRLLGALVALLAALCLWGCFVTHLYWGQVHDLSLVLRGAPSAGAQQAPPESGVVSDPALARQRALEAAWHGQRGDFAGVSGVRRAFGLALTFALMAAVVGGTCWLLCRLPASWLLRAVLLGWLVVASWAHWRLFRGPLPDPAERALWRRLALSWEGPPGKLPAPVAQDAVEALATLPARTLQPGLADAYRYLAMLGSWESGDPARAAALLAPLAARGYPAAVELRRQVEALGSEAEPLRLLPGTFFAPLPGDAGRAVGLPAAREAAAVDEAQAAGWEVAFDFRPGGLQRGAFYDVVTLQDGDRADVARFSLRGGEALMLATPQESMAAPLRLLPGQSYEVRLRRDPGAGQASLWVQAAGRNSVDQTGATGPADAGGLVARLDARLAPGRGVPARLLFGRNRQHAAAYPLWSAAFSDLRVAAIPCRPAQLSAPPSGGRRSATRCGGSAGLGPHGAAREKSN